jgi:hypothetical protein
MRLFLVFVPPLSMLFVYDICKLGCQLKLYGSSSSGFGLRDSDVNLFLQMAKDSVDDVPTILKRLLAEIKRHTGEIFSVWVSLWDFILMAHV